MEALPLGVLIFMVIEPLILSLAGSVKICVMNYRFTCTAQAMLNKENDGHPLLNIEDVNVRTTVWTGLLFL